jgi:predicted RNA-binding protein with TRAM domain
MYGNRSGGGGFRNGPQRSTAPVNVGDELDVRIEAVGEKGDGIAKKDGFVLFVPNVKEGDEVRIKVTRVLRKVGFAEVVGSSSKPKKDEAKEPEDELSEEELEAKASDDFGDEESAETTEESSEESSEDSTDDSTDDKSQKDEDEIDDMLDEDK